MKLAKAKEAGRSVLLFKTKISHCSFCGSDAGRWTPDHMQIGRCGCDGGE